MDGIVCSGCHVWFTPGSLACPGCGAEAVLEGEHKSVIDRIEPQCLIHRYDGSDMLETAAVVKAGKRNLKVATRLQEYAKPVTVPKEKTYHFDSEVLCAIQALRNERTAAINRYDAQIGLHWKKLRPYTD